MRTIIENIPDNACVEYTGDVLVTANIGRCAKVIVRNGNLTVDGDIGERTYVKLLSTSYAFRTHGAFSTNNDSVNEVSANVTFQVQGNVWDHVTVSSDYANLMVAGNIGSHCRFYTKNGEITGTNIGDCTSLTTECGGIEVSNVGVRSSLRTKKGNINGENVEKCASLITKKGDVIVDSADKSARLKSMCGDVYVGGVKQENEQQLSTVSSLSFIGKANQRSQHSEESSVMKNRM